MILTYDCTDYNSENILMYPPTSRLSICSTFAYIPMPRSKWRIGCVRSLARLNRDCWPLCGPLVSGCTVGSHVILPKQNFKSRKKLLYANSLRNHLRMAKFAGHSASPVQRHCVLLVENQDRSETLYGLPLWSCRPGYKGEIWLGGNFIAILRKGFQSCQFRNYWIPIQLQNLLKLSRFTVFRLTVAHIEFDALKQCGNSEGQSMQSSQPSALVVCRVTLTKNVTLLSF